MRGHASRLRLAGAGFFAAAVVLTPTAAGDPSEALRQRESDLAAQSRAAVLSLYSLESKLAAAQTRLAAIRARSEALRRERASVALRLQLAERGVRVSQSRLATRLRAIYERGDLDPIAIVLGADSLETAMTGLESLGQMASGDRDIVEELRGARVTLLRLQGRLADRQKHLDRLVGAATATARSLEAARASRAAYVRELASKRQMTQAAIARAAEQARAATEKALTLEPAPAPAAATDATAVAAPPAASPDGPAPAGGATLTVTATAYALPGRTATGLPVGWGVAAVDPAVIPLGTRFVVPGYGEAIAADIGGAVRGATIDLWFPSVAQAQAWGRRTVTITLR